MATVRDLIKGSLRLIGATDPGENLSPEEAADGLVTLNELLESLSIDGLLIHEYKRETFDLVPAQNTYTYGVGGDFNSARPVKIEMLTLEIENDQPYELPIEIVNQSQWAAIKLKDYDSEFPDKAFITGTFPLDTIYLYPIPSQAHKIVFYGVKPLTAYASVNDTISLPPGYYKLLRYNLAVALAPEYGKEVSPMAYQEAMAAKEDVRRVNFKPIVMNVGGNNSYNIYKDE